MSKLSLLLPPELPPYDALEAPPPKSLLKKLLPALGSGDSAWETHNCCWKLRGQNFIYKNAKNSHEIHSSLQPNSPSYRYIFDPLLHLGPCLLLEGQLEDQPLDL